MNKIIKENQKGFTLIEVLIAMTVFAIGILGVAAMQLSAIKGNSFASGMTEATTLAQDKMEELIMIAYNNPDLNDIDGDGTGGLRDPLPPLPAPPIPDPVAFPADYQLTSGPYTLYWNVAVNVPGTGVKTIGIIVTWVENGATKQVTINSVKAPM